MGFWGAFIIPAIELVGGYCVFWLCGVQVNVLNASGSTIEILFSHEGITGEWVAFCTHEIPYENEKKKISAQPLVDWPH